MKTIFFDVQENEEQFLKNNIPKEVNYILSKENVLNFDYSQNVDEVKIISTFVMSKLDKNTLGKFKNLEFILTRSVGYSHIDTKYCKEKNIKIFNTPNYGDRTVAEFVFGLLLSATRHIISASSAIRKTEVMMSDFCGVELYQKTLGVIGAGAIGSKVLEIAKGFKMNTIAYDSNPHSEFVFCDLDTLFKNSDIISINAPLNEKTRHLINKEAISKMKDGVIIINAARGEIIDTEALLDGLMKKKIAFVGLDVIECEEILCLNGQKCQNLENLKEGCLEKFYLNQKLLNLPNVVITPHIAYNTNEATMRILKITMENLKNCLNFNPSAKNLVLL